MWERLTRRWAAAACGCALGIAIAPAAAMAQQVGFRVTNDWGSGFQAEVRVTNTGAAALDAWVLEFDLNSAISSIWDARLVTHAGARYAIAGAAWNASIPAGGSVVFGFVASPGHVAAPTAFTLRSGAATSPTAAPRPATATRTITATVTRTASATLTPTRAVAASATASATRTSTTTVVAPTATRPAAPSTATFTPTATVAAAGAVRVAFARTTVWDSGYNAEIRITNTSAAGVSGWTLRFDLADAIGPLWNGRLQAGGPPHYTVLNESWNGTIAPGATVAIGFGATDSGLPSTPSACVFNGVACQFEAGSAPGPTPGGAAAPILIAGVDPPLDPVLQITVAQGVADFTLTLAGGGTPVFTAASNNPAVAGAAIVGGTTLRITAAAAGRAGLRVTDTASGAVRYVGIRVRTATGALPGLPDYVAVGSVSEDIDGDLALWHSFGSGPENTRVDARYLYLNGGPFGGWYDWAGGNGNRARGYIRESKTLGMIPFFVFYNVPDGGESYFTDLQHMQSASYMTAYFDNLVKALDIIRVDGGDEPVGLILEPDCIGYMMQLSGLQPPQIAAMVHTAYDIGILSHATDPGFPDTLTGLVEAVNYLIARRAPNAVFGWQFNLWASLSDNSGIPATGLMRITDSLGIAAGRARVALEAQKIADYYLAAGVLSYGADFVSIDKYGLDGGFDGAAAPWSSTWFWNAVHWNNYLLFASGLHQRTGMPVVLWQVPVGHINHSLAANPRSGTGLFPDLTNTYQRYEDSAPTFFFGDRFSTGGNAQRQQYFGQPDPDHPASVSIDGSGAIVWSSHMTAARDAGVIGILFGDGVGESTHARGLPPPDGYWWITQTQGYLQSPVALAP